MVPEENELKLDTLDLKLLCVNVSVLEESAVRGEK